MNIVSHVEYDNRQVLAISSGMSPYSISKSSLQRRAKEPGYILYPEGDIELWIPEGTFARNEQGASRIHHENSDIAQFYGPDFDGIPLLAIITDSDSQHAWKVLHSCIKAISDAGTTGGEQGKALLRDAAQAGPGAILVGKDGRILVLPGKLYCACLSCHGDEAERENRLEWVYPDNAHESAEKRFAFLAATCAYRIAGGVSPFMTGELWKIREKSGDTECAFISHLARSGFVPPLISVNPAVNPLFSSALSHILCDRKQSSVAELLAFPDSFEDIANAAPQPEDGTAGNMDNADLNQMKKRLSRGIFFRKNGTKLLVAGIIAGFFGIFGSLYISDMVAKPTTTGLMPVEVVTGFYHAVENLDADTLTTFAKTQAATEYINLVSGMYMTNRIVGRDVRDPGFGNPERLFRESLNATYLIYGITRLEAEEMEHTTDTARYTVSFYLFLPEETRDLDEETLLSRMGQPLTVYRYRDICTLEKKRDRWKIVGIDRLERTLAEPSGEAVFEAILSGAGDMLPFAPR